MELCVRTKARRLATRRRRTRVQEKPDKPPRFLWSVEFVDVFDNSVRKSHDLLGLNLDQVVPDPVDHGVFVDQDHVLSVVA